MLRGQDAVIPGALSLHRSAVGHLPRRQRVMGSLTRGLLPHISLAAKCHARHVPLFHLRCCTQGVSFEQKLVEVDDAYKALYNKAVDLWYEVWVYLVELERTGQLVHSKKVTFAASRIEKGASCCRPSPPPLTPRHVT